MVRMSNWTTRKESWNGVEVFTVSIRHVQQYLGLVGVHTVSCRLYHQLVWCQQFVSVSLGSQRRDGAGRPLVDRHLRVVWPPARSDHRGLECSRQQPGDTTSRNQQSSVTESSAVEGREELGDEWFGWHRCHRECKDRGRRFATRYGAALDCHLLSFFMTRDIPDWTRTLDR